MEDFIKILVGIAIGFFLHRISVKINYKQNLINDKIEYSTAIAQK